MCLDGTYPLYGVVLFSFPMYLSILVHAKRLTGQQLFLPERFRISYLITGAVKEGVIDLEELAYRLMELLHKFYPQTLLERYKVEAPEGTPGWQLLEMAARKRGYLISGGEVNTERMAKVLLDEFRSGKLGNFTLELPEDMV